MDKPFQPLPMFAGFPPIEPLIASLITISDEISSISNLPPVQVKNILVLTRRIRLLSPLFTEMQELKIPLVPSAILCFTELLSLMVRAKLLIQGCTESSYLWSLIQTEVLSKEFNAIVKEISRALDILLPLQMMNISIDVKEQVELLCKLGKRVDLVVDPKELERRKEVLQIIATSKENNDKGNGVIDVARAREILSSIGLRSSVDFSEEISKLKAEATNQGGTGGPIVVSRIHNIISLLSYLRSMVFSFEENEITLELLKQKIVKENLTAPASSSSRAMLTDVPNEFRCPISHEIMREPVTVATGHTYDRDSISKWVNSGHRTCPKSGWKLTHMALIPNYNLKSMIHQWHQDNNIPFNEFTPCSSVLHRSNKREDIGHSAVRLTSEYLVGKLATASPEMQCRAAYEIRLLAKSSMDNRKIIAEAGAIPFLVNSLSSHEPAMQENAVTALLNLSIHSDNKILIMEAAALQRILLVLETGKTMAAKGNAAAAISSLSIIDDYKASIGVQPRVVAALISLLQEGTTTAKRDAATALTNLAVYNPIQRTVVYEGAVPLLIGILTDEKAGITDDALALLTLLSGCSEGMEEITRTRSKDLVTLLVDLLKFGSQRGKENSVSLLLALNKDGAELVRHLDHQSFSLLRRLGAKGSPEARERANLLLRLLIKCCSNPANL
ncbi:U-box domain-containing protein 1-like [Spinacia oleracea]|uniref:RING-type E3 ubiquitin transferase n=1 Tax=Spinacia oleracea TaxID=3562 RepID=A0A9R0I349_SPIOL|nr:U-box domain-containing protein 1-like [Spinacia oleracea]